MGVRNVNKILSIGYGKIGKPFLEPFLNNKAFSISVVSPNNVSKPPTIHYRNFNSIDNEQKFDTVIFSCQTENIQSVMNEIPSYLYKDNTLFVSLINGLSKDYFRSKLGNHSRIAIMTPNLAVQLGKGIVGAHSDEDLSMFNCLGKIIYVKTQDDINKMNAMFGVNGAFVYHILASYKKALEDMNIGFVNKNHSEELDLNRLTLDLFEGSIEHMKTERNVHTEELKKRVMTTHGTAEQGIKAMEGLDTIFKKHAHNVYSNTSHSNNNNQN